MPGFYDNGPVMTYNFGEIDFGAGGDALAIKAPYGYSKGRILEVGVMVTETFTADTTPGYVRVGTAADADAYVELAMGTAADTNCYNTQDDTDAIIDADIPSTTQVEVACVAPTGGTPAGKGFVYIAIQWF